ncbi:hypothetical protein BJ165DRAFT_1424025 [Panaeolus papilionaceus]|nr:hypothetical protein BJ165DRAFT_1424025 [Panaeolus papilionaceus]
MSNDILSSSPSSIRGMSPVRRRSISPSEVSDVTSRPTPGASNSSGNPTRHSPILVRSFDPNDPQVRERQRTMDVDMAMQLSRARRETLHASPVATFASPSVISGVSSSTVSGNGTIGSSFPFETGVDDHPGMDFEADDERAREQDLRMGSLDEGTAFENDFMHEENGEGDVLPPRNLDFESNHHQLRSQPSVRSHRSHTHLTPRRHSTHHAQHMEDPSSSNYGLPIYQANVPIVSHFEFGPMEEFAAKEKAILGLNSPMSVNARFSLSALRGRAKQDAQQHEQQNHGEFGSLDLGISSAAELTRAETKQPAESSLRGSQSEFNNTHVQASSSGTSVPEVGVSLFPANEEGNQQAPLRHRKLSQSNTHPRSHRKGIGGKMALFESTNDGGANTFANRLGMIIGTQPSSGPSYDPMTHGGPGVGGGGIPGGILNTGHDRPYRFSFYSNALSATIHARSLSELPAEGQTFEQLFNGIQPQAPPPPFQAPGNESHKGTPHSAYDGPKNRPSSSLAFTPPSMDSNRVVSMSSTQVGDMPFADTARRPVNGQRNEKDGGIPNTTTGDQDGSTWWLDVLNPTDEEMKMLSKVFTIHPLTTEDILMEETREKIELFRNYYLVCFRSFDQDPYSPTHLEPLNMYIIVFREGILSFHFRSTPHPQNVRRRIKQLKDYISVTSDWISYALIDDITDAFAPLIQGIEYEVDSIDELVLILKEAEQSDMLRRIGTCRKKVMGLLRLMGNKADVVKGLAKRCNENWRVAPTSDIGLYLSDIQDHLITMTQNLNHYEKILSRSHSNYLAQISIEMTDANNQINDVLSKLTALGTVLIPMNLVTGLWGMNVHVPGQDVPGYAWFVSIIACLAAFALIGGYSTYRFMVRK